MAKIGDTDIVKLFLELLKAGLWEHEVKLPGSGDYNYAKLYKLSQEQAVLGLIAAGLEQANDFNVPKEVALAIAGEMLQIEQHNTAMNYFIGVLIEKMANARISSLLIKGQGIAQCYERPLWRACGDVDLVLDKENYDKAKHYLIPLATHVDDEDCNRLHLGMTIDSWVLELHGTLHSSLLPKKMDELSDVVLDDMFKSGAYRVWKNEQTEVLLPAPDNNVVLVFLHILQHFFSGGIGLRQICDWCRLLWAYRSEIDKSLLEKRLSEAGLMTEWKVFAALAVDTLGMPQDAMPFYSKENKWNKKAEGILSLVIETGNFGHNRDNSYQNSKTYIVRKVISFGRATWDNLRRFKIFPMDSIRVWGNMLMTGVKTVVEGK